MPAAADKAGKKKKGEALPPKPALYTEDEWGLAHSVPRLLELLSVPEKPAPGGSSSKEKPLATKQAAALWLWQLLSKLPDAKEEALRSKAAEVISKLLTAAGADAHVSAHLLACLQTLASPATDIQAVAVCEGVLATKPPVVPWLLKQLEQSAGGSAGIVAGAALGLLHAMLDCAETRPAVCKILAGWSLQPLVAALTSQQALPLLGGRNVSAHAAAVLELLCTPPAPSATAAAAQAGGTGKDNGTKGGKSRAGSAASSKASAGGAGGTDRSLSSVLQQGVLAAGGLPALLKVCTATGSTAACRCSAVAALQHILATHGHSPAVKQQLLAADGLSVLVQMLGRDKLPLACRAAAAGCIYHFLAPQGAQQPGNSTAAGTGGTLAGLQKGALLQTPDGLTTQPAASTIAAGTLSTAAAAATTSKPGTSSVLSKSIIRDALQQRRQQQQQQHSQAAVAAGFSSSSSAGSRGPSGDGGGTARNSSSSGGAAVSSRSSAADSSSGASSGLAAASVRPSTAAAAAAAASAAAALSASLTLQPAAGDVAAAAVAAQREALLSQWDAPARKGLAACAEQAIAAGVLPALLLLCCGPEGPPAALEAAVAAATAAARSSPPARPHTADSPPGHAQDRGAVSSASINGALPAAAADAKPLARRPTLSSGGAAAAAAAGEVGGHVDETLDSIAEPSQAAEGDDDDALTSGSGAGGPDSSRGVSASSTGSTGSAGGAGAAGAEGVAQTGGKTKQQGGKKQKKSKKPVKLEPAMVEAQTQASAALKLLALSGDAARRSLLEAGALQVLLPLLDGSVSAARWNARQALLSLSLVATPHTVSTGPSNNPGSSNGGTSSAQPHPDPLLMATKAATAAAAAAAAATTVAGLKIPSYISLGNMPASHWLPVVPLSLPPAPPLPSYPGRRGGEGVSGGGAATGNGRPSSQGRRASVSNLSSAVTQASRMSSTSSFMDGSGAANTSAGGSPPPRTTKGPRSSIGLQGPAATAAVGPTAAAAAIVGSAGAAGAAGGGAAVVAARGSSAVVQGGGSGEQQQGMAEAV